MYESNCDPYNYNVPVTLRTLKWGENVAGFLCTKPYRKTVPLRIADNPVIQNDGYPNFLEIQD